MESLRDTAVLKFYPDTLQHVRKEHNLERPNRIKEAVDILDEWIQKQNHFEVKHFPREYLERLIINNKGLLENSKKKLDRLCTLRTLSSDYFDFIDLNECSFDIITYVLLPKLTPKRCRVGIVKMTGNHFSSKIFYNHFRSSILVSDYQQTLDYCSGVVYLVDFNDGSMVDYVLNMNLLELKRFIEIFLEGYSMRIKEIHLLTSSKSVQILITLFKQVLSEKLMKRLIVHNKVDTVYEYIPKQLLPQEYGGEEKRMQEIHDCLLKELTSKEFTELKKEMNKCRTNEELRRADKFNDEYMGVSGTFRNLRVD